jgi:hypothetical protein
MKIGSSLSRCVLDIYNDTVVKYDVLVIIARTDFDPTDDMHWNNIWNGYGGGANALGNLYSNAEWRSIPAEDEQKLRDIILDLYDNGKIHQPRQFGARPQRFEHYWYDVILSDEVVDSTPAAKKAWDNYKLLAGLS